MNDAHNYMLSILLKQDPNSFSKLYSSPESDRHFYHAPAQNHFYGECYKEVPIIDRGMGYFCGILEEKND